jgi:catechol 2,3-dioxygenase-like lactoylglutathione lyase family enzyme
MKLGTYVEVRIAVDDMAAALAWLEQVGMKKVADTVVTDGGLNIGLQTEPLTQPTLVYYGADKVETLNAPNNVQIVRKAETAPAPMPEGDIMSRQPVSRLGKFGEYAIPTGDFEASAKFWEAHGFNRLHADSNPYPWGIFADDLTVIGLHQVDPTSGQPTFDEPHITYFAGDMADRIATLKGEGLPVRDVEPLEDGQVVNAVMTGPGNQPIFLFNGEI